MIDDLDIACCAFCTTTEEEDELFECENCGLLFCSVHGDVANELCDACLGNG